MARKSLVAQLNEHFSATLSQTRLGRARSIDWKFIRSSSVNSMGIAIARVLGFAFSFVIAHAYSADEYGRVVYTLMLANVLSMLVQPFGQHVIAYYIGKYQREPAQLERVMGNAWLVWFVLLGLTLLLAIPALILLDRFSWGVIAVFVGTGVFYLYYGISSGFISSSRLLAVYLGSNVLQIVLVWLVVYVLRVDSATPAIFIYGLSYFAPLLLVTRFAPLPLSVRWRREPQEILSILRFSLPIWLSHLLYLGYTALDVILLEHFGDDRVVGVYGLTKTISTVFHFFPLGIKLFLMPRIAGSPKEEHVRILKQSLLVVLVVNLAGITGYLLFYRWFMVHFIGREYYDSLLFGGTMALAAVLFGFHSLVSAMLVGAQRASVETVSRAIMMVIMIGLGLVLVPTHGALGTAITSLVAVIGGLVYYSLALFQQTRS